MRKKIFAVIMSAMMLITFMPSMAFADETTTLTNITWSDDYTKCTADWVGTGKTIQVSATISKSFGADGCITAKADFTDDMKEKNPGDWNLASTSSADLETKYIDLTGATLACTTYEEGGYIKGYEYVEALYNLEEQNIEKIDHENAWIYDSIDDDYSEKTQVEKLLLGGKIHLVKPECVGGDVTSAEPSFDTLKGLGFEFVVKVKPSSYEAYDKDGEYSFPVQIQPKSKATKNVIGKVDTSQNLSIRMKDNDKWSFLKWSLDGENVRPSNAMGLVNDYYNQNSGILSPLVATNNSESNAVDLGTMVTEYNGKDQKFEISTSNMDVEYGLWNDVEGKYVYTKTPTIVRDVKLNNVYTVSGIPEFQSEANTQIGSYMIMLKITRNSIVRYCKLKIKVFPAAIAYRFNQDSYIYGKGEKINVSDLISYKVFPHLSLRFDYIASTGMDIASDFGKVVTRYDEIEWQDIYDVDKTNINTFIDQNLGINGLINGIGTSEMTIKAKNIFDDSYVSFNKSMKNGTESYRRTIGNYYFININEIPSLFKEKAILTITDKYNDITACDKTKTYHIKKAKKLAKTKTFKLKAVADYGKITFIKKSGNNKIKVAEDGTVTVKKGLKKGKYVVKVRVKAPNAKDTMKLTIKIRK